MQMMQAKMLLSKLKQLNSTYFGISIVRLPFVLTSISFPQNFKIGSIDKYILNPSPSQ